MPLVKFDVMGYTLVRLFDSMLFVRLYFQIGRFKFNSTILRFKLGSCCILIISCTPDKDIWYFILAQNSYLTHVILPRLSREDCLLVVCIGTLAHGRHVTSMFSQSDSSCDIAYQRIHGLLEAYF